MGLGAKIAGAKLGDNCREKRQLDTRGKRGGLLLNQKDLEPAKSEGFGRQQSCQELRGQQSCQEQGGTTGKVVSCLGWGGCPLAETSLGQPRFSLCPGTSLSSRIFPVMK